MCLCWLKLNNYPGTPDPNAEETPSEAQTIKSANENVIQAAKQSRKRGQYDDITFQHVQQLKKKNYIWKT